MNWDRVGHIFHSHWKGYHTAEVSLLSHNIQMQVGYENNVGPRRESGRWAFLALNSEPGFTVGYDSDHGLHFQRYARVKPMPLWKVVVWREEMARIRAMTDPKEV
jgi:hypothetical protein